jgi:hypothetical protein
MYLFNRKGAKKKTPQMNTDEHGFFKAREIEG